MSSLKAICPGTFDPPSDGHLNIIARCLKIFDHVTVAVAISNSKNAIFAPQERVAMLKELLKNKKNVEIVSFKGLLVEYCRHNKISTIVRGIRTVQDYEFELQMSLANRNLDDSIETIFMMTEGRYSHISSTIIKQIISLGGSGAGMIHPLVEKKLRQKLRITK